MSARAAEPLTFVLVGAAGFGVNLAAFAAFLALDMPYALASVAAYLLANALMYLGNRYLTFRLGSAGFWRAYLRYTLVGCLVAALTVALVALLVECAELDARFAQPLALLLVTPIAFVLFKRWTFRLALT